MFEKLMMLEKENKIRENKIFGFYAKDF